MKRLIELGDRVRVVSVSPLDKDPQHKVGDEFTVEWIGAPGGVATELCMTSLASTPALLDGGDGECVHGRFELVSSPVQVRTAPIGFGLAPIEIDMIMNPHRLPDDAPGVPEPADEYPDDAGAAVVDACVNPVRDTVPCPPFMSTDSAMRKRMPVTSGVLAYFPDALLCVSFISKVGNDKHNPGEPLHWAKEKSTDEPDCEVRHMLDFLRDIPQDAGLEELGKLGHLSSKAWRALAHLQRECDAVRAKYHNGKDWRK